MTLKRDLPIDGSVLLASAVNQSEDLFGYGAQEASSYAAIATGIASANRNVLTQLGRDRRPSIPGKSSALPGGGRLAWC